MPKMNDEVDLVIEDVEVNGEGGENEDVTDEVDVVVLVVGFGDHAEADVDVVDACVEAEVDVDVGVVDDDHVENAVADLL